MAVVDGALGRPWRWIESRYGRASVSADTIRRDLDQLDSEGVIIRTHGGAMSNSAILWHDTGLDDRSRLQPGQKEQIGLTAAQLFAVLEISTSPLIALFFIKNI